MDKHLVTLENMCLANKDAMRELRSQLNDSSMTMKEYQGVKDTLFALTNHARDLLELSIVMKEG